MREQYDHHHCEPGTLNFEVQSSKTIPLFLFNGTWNANLPGGFSGFSYIFIFFQHNKNGGITRTDLNGFV